MKDETAAILFGMAIGVLVAGILAIPFMGGISSHSYTEGYNKGLQEGIQMYRQDAAERGYGEWIPDNSGKTQFRWKTLTVKPEAAE